MDDLALKLKRLKALDNISLFRWSASTKRIGGKFIPLSEIRLNILNCNTGVVHLSVAAPVLHMEHGRPRVRFYDEGVLRVTAGARANINLLPSQLKKDEEAVEVRNCIHQDCGEDSCRMVANKVLSIGNSVSYPVCRLVLPDMFRLTARLETLRPVYTKQLLSLIDAEHTDSSEELHRKFIGHIEMFGYQTDEGWIINNEIVAAGGMVCLAADGISRSAGGPVFQIPSDMLSRQLSEKGWAIRMKEENKEEQENGLEDKT